LMTAVFRRPCVILPRPHCWALAISTAAWLAILALHLAPDATPLCLAEAGGSSLTGRLRAAWVSGGLGLALLDWVLMTLAMMTPLTLPLLGHVAARSFASRRHRAIALVLVGALAPWLLAGLVGLPLLLPASAWAGGPPWLAVSGFLLAAVWQLSSVKRRALQRCHLTLPLAAEGRRADLDCTWQGLVHARSCLLSCGPLMLAMTLAPDHLLIGACIQSFLLAERRSCRPPLMKTAVALTIIAAAVSAATRL
jgi:predicted metal-binding membrane protein